MKKFALAYILIGFLVNSLYAEEIKEKDIRKKEEGPLSLQNILSKEFYANTPKKREKDKEELREEWKELLHGLDIYYPYFKMKEIEDWLGEKTKLEIFNFKGKPEIENNEIFYIFRMKL